MWSSYFQEENSIENYPLPPSLSHVSPAEDLILAISIFSRFVMVVITLKL